MSKWLGIDTGGISLVNHICPFAWPSSAFAQPIPSAQIQWA
ncbi:TPA: hypothetical protein ACPZPW_004493 [Yersinia enterocolitica]